MPGIIVSRPIFNTLFKLAHEEGLSINAFLTRLLEKAGPDAVAQTVAGTPLTTGPVETAAETAGPSVAAISAGEVEIIGSERVASEMSRTQTAGNSLATEPDAVGGVPGLNGQDRGRRIGNSIWDRVVSMEGHRFATSRGKRFSYKVTGEYIIVRDSSARIPRSQFDKAQKMWPVSGPSRLVGVYAPSVVWAVMKEAAEPEAAFV